MENSKRKHSDLTEATVRDEHNSRAYEAARKRAELRGEKEASPEAYEALAQAFNEPKQPPRSLDPRRYPWKRGDICTRGFEKNGFVLSHTAEYLEIRWMGKDEGIERVPTEDVDSILRVALADSLGPSGIPNTEACEAIEALSRIEDGIKERMKRVKNENEREELDALTRRVFATNKCAWDEKHSAELFLLLLEPKKVGVAFRIRDKIHRASCKQHEKSQ